ncbi:VWA domain-containing protein [Gammaproteobacteria bacterium]|nr:VWA domain-containing protein [Gammaproteobacteria bacterium]MEC8314620.1 VWA domain-containing protein [Pseudomonadota bacterium]MEC8449007.1 VWA domain-containing protein [Pseudomonadota bacterium]MED5348986.1 VWA domain-containing protein [Pseudomonadota bacterium]GIR86629.1 MAG: VWA domain-containing protein [Gammaproteobacteria bacterium]|tara:strand:- start:5274 stop:6449 length:1176 start_codon:yes stop_codon:yes gene_type:complete
MFISLFNTLKATGVPVSLRELLDLIGAVDKGLAFANMDEFYYLSRAILVKDEKHYDKFDRAFDIYFKGIESLDDILEMLIPDEWLKAEFEKHLTEEELKEIKSLGGLEKLLAEFKKKLEEQDERHEGGSKYIGTGGTSPFGNSGENPEGIRVGGEGGKGKAAKVWEARDFKNLDDDVELGTRNMKVALRRLRKLIRDSADEEFDLDNTISSTAKKAGLLDVKFRPEKRNAVKVIVLFDVGGSMDPHIKICEELFSAAKTEFKNLEYFYFHNFIYETVWKDNRRRQNERIYTEDIIHKYSADYKIIFVGDATMAPYEITNPGGSIEHWNEEAGALWMKRMVGIYDKLVWLNPVPEEHWEYSASVELTRSLVEDNMFPLTIRGLEESMSYLSK